MTKTIASQLESLSSELPKLISFLKDSYLDTSTQAIGSKEFDAINSLLKKTLGKVDAVALMSACEELKVPADLTAWLASFTKNMGDVADALATKASTQVNVLRVQNGEVELDFQVSLMNQLPGVPMKVEVVIGKNKVELQQTGEEAGHYIFDQDFAQSAYFNYRFPVSQLSGRGSIKIVLTDAAGKSRASALAYRPASHLLTMRFQNWTKAGVTFRGQKKQITFEPASLPKRIIREVLYTLAMTERTLKYSGLKSALGFLLVRICYWLSYPFLNGKEIWITHDKMYSALDSGEYFYWHMHNNQRKKVTPFYAINKNSKDVPRLKKMGAKLLHPLTLKHYLYYLHADVYVTTASGSDVYNGFTGRASQRYRDLIDGRVLCIQHGLIIQGVYRTMHRGRAGIERIFCASNVEVKNLTNPKFGYTKEQLPKAGFARFDGLIDARTKTLMISPTWRRELTGPSAGLANPRKANSIFTKTEFFKTYAEALINEKLMLEAKASGYKLQFVLHPLLAGSADLMRNGFAEVAKKLGISELYEETVEVVGAGLDKSFDSLIRESAGLVTDYSGVQFDVAYMRKPVIYFHPESIPAQYDNGPMSYEKDGFGPVTKTVKDLQSAIIKEFNPETSSSKKYGSRVDAFFENIDHSNCARVFEDAYAFTR